MQLVLMACPNELWAVLALQLADVLQADMAAFRRHIAHRILDANSPSSSGLSRLAEQVAAAVQAIGMEPPGAPHGTAIGRALKASDNPEPPSASLPTSDHAPTDFQADEPPADARVSMLDIARRADGLALATQPLMSPAARCSSLLATAPCAPSPHGGRCQTVLLQQAERQIATLQADLAQKKADLAAVARAREVSCHESKTPVLAACDSLAHRARSNGDKAWSSLREHTRDNSSALSAALVEAGVFADTVLANRAIRDITMGVTRTALQGTHNFFYALGELGELGLRVSKAQFPDSEAIQIAKEQQSIATYLSLEAVPIAIPGWDNDKSLVVSLSPNYGLSLDRSRMLDKAAASLHLQEQIFSAVLSTIDMLSNLRMLYHDCKPDNVVLNFGGRGGRGRLTGLTGLTGIPFLIITDFDQFVVPVGLQLSNIRGLHHFNATVSFATFYVNRPTDWVLKRIIHRVEYNYTIAYEAYNRKLKKIQTANKVKLDYYNTYGPVFIPEVDWNAEILANIMKSAVVDEKLRTTIGSFLSTFMHYVKLLCLDQFSYFPTLGCLKDLGKQMHEGLKFVKPFLKGESGGTLYSRGGHALRDTVARRFFSFLFHVLYAFSGRNLHPQTRIVQHVAPAWSEPAFVSQCIYSRGRLIPSFALLVEAANSACDSAPVSSVRRTQCISSP
jgi:hypothetical protein